MSLSSSLHAVAVLVALVSGGCAGRLGGGSPAGQDVAEVGPALQDPAAPADDAATAQDAAEPAAPPDASGPADDADSAATGPELPAPSPACEPGACDDGNPCTDDDCDSAVGCTAMANDAACDDGDACTQADHCAASTCAGAPLACDDGNPCTDDGCDPAAGCTAMANDAACDDGDACTQADHCAGAVCGGVPVACDDGNPCTVDACQPPGGCTAAEPTVCDDGNACTADGCDPALGCTHVAQAGGCEDGDTCSLQDTCQAGVCAGVPATCVDGNPCTLDACDPSSGCVHPATGPLPCDDGKACTASDACQGGACVGVDLCPVDEPFDCGAPGWSFGDGVDGVGWAIDASPAAPGYKSAGCSLNINNGKNFATGGKPILAKAESWPIELPAAGYSKLTFSSYQDLGNVPGAAKRYVGIRDAAGQTTWIKLPAQAAGQWAPTEVTLAKWIGQTVRIQFIFEATAAVDGSGVGWFVDDLQIVPETGTCEGKCGIYQAEASCQCDVNCAVLGTCCPDWASECQACSGQGCEDGNPCTVDQCEPTSGMCKSAPKACDDGNPCTLDGCQPQSGCTHVLSAELACHVPISGRVTYDRIPVATKPGGQAELAYAKAKVVPARRVVVQAILAADGKSVLAEARTDDHGKYLLYVPKSTPVFVRARAWLKTGSAAPDGIVPDACQGASWDLRVVDNTQQDAMYALDGPTLTAPATQQDLHAQTAWAGGKYGPRHGAPFAIADTFVDGLELFCQGKPDLRLPRLLVGWSPANTSAIGNKALGEIGGAHFSPPELRLYLTGKADVNTDEYDQAIVGHEFAHFVESAALRSDSVGGPHGLGDVSEPSVAFSEGYATAVGALAARSSVVADTQGPGQSGGYWFDLGMEPLGNDRGVYSERSVGYLLWWLWEHRDEPQGSGSLDRIWQVLSGPLKTTPARVSLLAFAAWYRHLFGGQAEDLQALWSGPLGTPYHALCVGTCPGEPDPFDVDADLAPVYAANRTYPMWGPTWPAAFWELYRPLAPGLHKANAHAQIRTGQYFHAGNKWGTNRWHRLVGTGELLEISVTALSGTSCQQDLLDLTVYHHNGVVAADLSDAGPTAGCPSVVLPTQAGAVYTVRLTGRYDVSGWDLLVK